MLDAGHPFDVLVTDVSLPGMSGTDLARRLLADDPLRWVVLCSGYELGSQPGSWGAECAHPAQTVRAGRAGATAGWHPYGPGFGLYLIPAAWRHLSLTTRLFPLERLTKLFWRRCRVLSYYAYCLRRGA